MTFFQCCNRCGCYPCRCSCNRPICQICVGPTGPTGARGATGATGATGFSAVTVSVGETVTSEPGTAASVTQTGTENAVLTFTIPRGATGADGATGPTGATGADGATGPTGATGADATITPAAAVADVDPTADAATIAATLNSLLASLRAAGLLET